MRGLSMLRMMDDFEVRALRSDALERERAKWFIAAKERHQRQELRQDNADQELLDLATSVILADAMQVEAFRTDLDTYDAMTIEALMENREILERLYLERQALLDNAYQLDDGTHVFKSEDGKRVIDEAGNSVSSQIVDPDQILDHHTSAEDWERSVDQINKHEAIEQNLIDYQEKLDAAREQLYEGELTQDEFDELKSGIEADMPIEVRRKLPDYDPSQETDLTSDFTATAKKAIEIAPADMAIDPSMVPGMN